MPSCAPTETLSWKNSKAVRNFRSGIVIWKKSASPLDCCHPLGYSIYSRCTLLIAQIETFFSFKLKVDEKFWCKKCFLKKFFYEHEEKRRTSASTERERFSRSLGFESTSGLGCESRAWTINANANRKVNLHQVDPKSSLYLWRFCRKVTKCVKFILPIKHDCEEISR